MARKEVGGKVSTKVSVKVSDKVSGDVGYARAQTTSNVIVLRLYRQVLTLSPHISNRQTSPACRGEPRGRHGEHQRRLHLAQGDRGLSDS